jgi:hypothetical protein
MTLKRQLDTAIQNVQPRAAGRCFQWTALLHAAASLEVPCKVLSSSCTWDVFDCMWHRLQSNHLTQI